MAEETPKPSAPKGAAAPETPAPKAPTRPADAKENFRYIVRLANTDIEGARSVVYALTKVKGIGIRVAETVANLAGVPRTERIGNLTEAETEKIEAVLAKLGDLIPPWMVNRPNDWETGADLHLYSSDVDLRLRDDINRMKMIRCYRGIRHEQGQKVRGQRTRSNGRTGLTVGVVKKTAIAAAKAAEKEEGGKKEKKE
jgi:small subunit ribosomal protein S13